MDIQILRTRLELYKPRTYNEIDWKAARADVEPFLKSPELEGLEMWSGQLFNQRVEKLGCYLE